MEDINKRSRVLSAFKKYKPEVTLDGDVWVCLLGLDLQSGVAGFGKTPYLAIEAWYDKFNRLSANRVAIRENFKELITDLSKDYTTQDTIVALEYILQELKSGRATIKGDKDGTTRI